MLEAAHGGMAAGRASGGGAAPARAVVPPLAAAAGVSFPILLQAWRLVPSSSPLPSSML